MATHYDASRKYMLIYLKQIHTKLTIGRSSLCLESLQQVTSNNRTGMCIVAVVQR